MGENLSIVCHDNSKSAVVPQVALIPVLLLLGEVRTFFAVKNKVRRHRTPRNEAQARTILLSKEFGTAAHSFTSTACERSPSVQLKLQRRNL